MRFAKRLLMGAGAVALAAMVLSVTAPKVVRATVSALVQVTNTSSSPVPVAAVPVPAVQVTAFSAPEGSAVDVHGPFDVSSYSTIRLSAGGAGPQLSPYCIAEPNGCQLGSVTYAFSLIGFDSNGNSYALDSFIVQGAQSTSRVYQLPGTSIEVQISAACNGCGSAVANVAIFGR